MGLNNPRDLNKIPPDFWLLKWVHRQFLADLKAHGVPELGENLNLVNECYDVVLVDFNEYCYLCSISPALYAEALYTDVKVDLACEDDEVREGLWAWFQEGGVMDPFYIDVSSAEMLKTKGVKVETTQKEIFDALGDVEGDHEAAYALLRERIREYYTGNPPL